MKNIIYLFVLILSAGGALAQDLDTVWTHDITQYKHRSQCARFMPDGKSIIAGVGNNLIEIETLTGKLIRKFEPLVNSKVVAIEISNNGTIIIGRSELYEYYKWDYLSGKYLGIFNYNDIVKTDAASFAFHPFDNKVYMTLRDSLILFNLITNKTEKISKMPLIGARNLAISKDGKFLAMSFSYLNNDQLYHSKLYLFDAIKWEMIKELDDITRDVHSIVFSPNSKYVAFTSLQNEEAFLRLYNLQTGTTKLYPSGYWGFEPWSAIFTKDEKYLLASGGYNSNSKLLQIESEKTIYTIKHGAEQRMIDINSNNQILFDELDDINLINSKWFTTSVPPDPRIKINGNMKIKYMNEVLSLDNTDSELIKVISVFDINGKLVKTYDAGYSGATVELPFSAPAGVYLVRIVTDRSDYNFKFVRE